VSDLISILVVDEHEIVRRGMATLLVARNAMQVIGEAADGEEAVVKAHHLKADVILMDLLMPRLDGLEAIRAILAEDATARILVLTSFDEDSRVTAVIKAGALGYLRKDASPDALFHAIRNAAKGASYLPQEIMQKLIRDLQHTNSTTQVGIDLTEREIDVLGAIAKGMSNQEIAETLFISTTTVRTHVRNLLGKLGVTNRTQAALYAVQSGIAHKQ
jgi:DNA-binding NarL/FixJ family response regulator